MRFLMLPLMLLSTVGFADRTTEISARITEQRKPGPSLALYTTEGFWTLGVSAGAVTVSNATKEAIYRPDVRVTGGLAFDSGVVSVRQRIGYGRQSLIDQQFEGYFVQNLGLATTFDGLVGEVGVESRLVMSSKADPFLGSYASVGYRF